MDNFSSNDSSVYEVHQIETSKFNLPAGTNYGVQYIDVTNDPTFTGIETGFVNSQTVKVRRTIDLTTICEQNKEVILSGTEFTAAELEAILTNNAEGNGKVMEPLEVSPLNSKIDLTSATTSNVEYELEEDELQDGKQLIDLNTPIYLDVSGQNEDGIIIETDIAGTIEVGTDNTLISANSSMVNLSSSEEEDKETINNNLINELDQMPSETKQITIVSETSKSPNEEINGYIPEEELKLIESLTNKRNSKPQDIVNNMTAYNQSKNYEILKAAKSLYSKRTRTLWHWMDPNIPKTKLKNIVLVAWDALPAWQKQIYISQVLGKFSMDVVTPMVNPQLAGLANNPAPSSDQTPQPSVAKKRMYIHKPTQKWDFCFKSKKKKNNGLSTPDSPT